MTNTIKPTRKRSQEIRNYIIDIVDEHPNDIVPLAVERFGVSRQSISGHVKKLVNEGILEAKGNTRAREYRLRPVIFETFVFPVIATMEEDVVWRDNISPLLEDMPKNVLDICQYGFTEMLNNVISHSEAQTVFLELKVTAKEVQLTVRDNGIGIFKKLQRDFNLNDPRHALLELSKGKITSDESKHTGEGIFFTSRMFDVFVILSNPLFFSRIQQNNDWLTEADDRDIADGTMIVMNIAINTTRTTAEIFDAFTSQDTRDFSRTHVPIDLARYGTEQLVSRSQARRVLARFERFQEVLLDFTNVDTIGRAFADEIFRVYRIAHPKTKVIPLSMSSQIEQLVMEIANQQHQEDSSSVS